MTTTSSDDRLQDRFTITGTGQELDEQQLGLLALAEELGPRFGRRAARYDQERAFRSRTTTRCERPAC
jgi:hypothetical protein